MPKTSGTGRRYSAAEKQRILTAATSEGLTGNQVRERFGVSTLTFYKWRGPKRGRRPRQAAAPTRNGSSATLDGMIQEEIRSNIRRVLPQLIKEEIASAIEAMLPGRAAR